MSAIAVVTDSTAALPDFLVRRHDIGVVPVQLVVGMRDHFQDGQISEFELLHRLSEGVTTNAPAPFFFEKAFREKVVSGAREIIAVVMPAKASRTMESAVVAARNLKEEFDSGQVRIHVVDSGFVSMGLGWQTLRAAQLAEQGVPVEEILASLADLKARTRLFVVLDDLSYAYKGGRLSRSKYYLAEATHTKGIVQMVDGEVVQIGAIPLMNFALRKMAGLITRAGRYELATISSSTGDPNAEKLAALLEKQGLVLDPRHVPMPTTVLSHAGPGAIGFVGVLN